MNTTTNPTALCDTDHGRFLYGWLALSERVQALQPELRALTTKTDLAAIMSATAATERLLAELRGYTTLVELIGPDRCEQILREANAEGERQANAKGATVTPLHRPNTPDTGPRVA